MAREHAGFDGERSSDHPRSSESATVESITTLSPNGFGHVTGQ
ncbi:hypothetical protein [Halomontanus rarus]